MPDIGATIRTVTLENATVSSLIGTRMHADVPPQGVLMPAIVYTVVDTIPYEHLSGIADVSRARIQIDCAANTRSEANALADAVRLALEKQQRGEASDGQFINEINLVTGESYSTIAPEAGSDKRRYVTQLDFFVHYRTTTS